MRYEIEKFIKDAIKDLQDKLEDARVNRGLHETALLDPALRRFLPSDMQLMIGEITGLLRVAVFLLNGRETPINDLSSKEASKKALSNLYERIQAQLEINPYPWYEKIEITREGPLPDDPVADDHYVTTRVMELAVLNYFANIPDSIEGH